LTGDAGKKSYLGRVVKRYVENCIFSEKLLAPKEGGAMGGFNKERPTENKSKRYIVFLS